MFRRPNLSLNADVPHAGFARAAGRPLACFVGRHERGPLSTRCGHDGLPKAALGKFGSGLSTAAQPAWAPQALAGVRSGELNAGAPK
jgi:hypothetical protein